MLLVKLVKVVFASSPTLASAVSEKPGAVVVTGRTHFGNSVWAAAEPASTFIVSSAPINTFPPEYAHVPFPRPPPGARVRVFPTRRDASCAVNSVNGSMPVAPTTVVSVVVVLAVVGSNEDPDELLHPAPISV